MKICKKCSIELDLESFSKRKDSKDGYRNICKICTNKNNIGRNKEYYKKYSILNKEKLIEKGRVFYLNNKERIKKSNKNWVINNKEKMKELQKKHYLNNKEEIYKKRNKRRNEKLKSDPLFKCETKVRSLIGNSIRRNGFSKKQTSQQILGCNFKEFKSYIESQFEPWMSWDNYGKYNGELNYGWDIDHIIPVSSATTEEEIIKLNHHKNLQPLCSYTNRVIKKNKILC